MTVPAEKLAEDIDTEEMPMQAPAATASEAAEGAAEKVKEAVADATEAVKEAVGAEGDGAVEDHDEL